MAGSRYELRGRTPSQKSDPSRTISGGNWPSDTDTSNPRKRKRKGTKETANSAAPQRNSRPVVVVSPKSNSILHESSSTEIVDTKQRVRRCRTETENSVLESSSATEPAVDFSSCEPEQCIDPLNTCGSEQIEASTDTTQYPADQPVSGDVRSSGRCLENDMNEEWEQRYNDMNVLHEQDRPSRTLVSPLRPSIMDDFSVPGSPQYTGNYSPINLLYPRIQGGGDMVSPMDITRGPGSCFASRPPSRMSEIRDAGGQALSQLVAVEQQGIMHFDLESANLYNNASTHGDANEFEIPDSRSEPSEIINQVLEDLIDWGSSLPRR